MFLEAPRHGVVPLLVHELDRTKTLYVGGSRHAAGAVCEDRSRRAGACLRRALEDRHPHFVASFAVGCALAAVYALLISSYPFLIAESIWCVIAFARWRRMTQPV